MSRYKLREHSIPLSFRRDEILDFKHHGYQKIPRPIIEVDNDYLILSNLFVIFRNLCLIPLFVSMSYFCFIEINELYNNWKASEKKTIRYIMVKKELYGDDYFDHIPVNEKFRENMLFKYNRLDDQGKLPFKQYMIERYGGKLYAYPDHLRKRDNSYIRLFGTTIPLLFIAIICFKRRAPLIVDRRRRLLYTWRRGRVIAQRYDNLRMLERSGQLTLVLRIKKNKGKLGWTRFPIAYHMDTIDFSKDYCMRAIAFIVRFMEDGKEKVMPDKEVWSGWKGVFLFEDKKPDDFEEQLTELLEFIDAANDEVEFNIRAYESF